MSGDIVWGARSALQKAIRRGDLALGEFAFNQLWNDSKQRDWLHSRLPILAAEEAYQLLPETAVAMRSFDSKKTVFRFIVQLILSSKMKDACCFESFIDHPQLPQPKNDEAVKSFYRTVRENITSQAQHAFHSAGRLAAVDAEMILRDVGDEELRFRALEAINLCKWRLGFGSMVGDRYLLIGAIYLWAFYPVAKKDVDSDLSTVLQKFKDGGSDRTFRGYPWYVFDMHTQIGKIAYGIFWKKNSKWVRDALGIDDKHKLWLCWFILESGRVLPHLLHNVDDRSKHPLATVWFKPLMREILRDLVDPDKLLANWVEASARIRGCVEWLMRERGCPVKRVAR